MVSELSKDDLFKIRKKKIEDEIHAAKRILKKNIEPLEIADNFIHNSLELMKDGILTRYPELSEIEIKEKVRETLNITKKLKKLRHRDKIFG